MINIFILNWNSSESVLELIKSISNSTYKLFRIILIDNNSEISDRSKIIEIYEDYRSIFDIHLILNKENYGYAKGNNEGYEYLVLNNLDGDLVILNADMQISKNTFQIMLNSLQDDIGGVMARTKSIDNAKILYDYIKLKGFMQKYETSNDKICQTDYLAGSCMLLKRILIDEIGLFDESFFMYWEDVELSFRIKGNGYKIVSTTETSIYRSENDPIRTANAIYFSSKNAFTLFKKYSYFNLFDLIYYQFRLFLSCLKIAVKEKKIRVIRYLYLGVLSGIKNSTN